MPSVKNLLTGLMFVAISLVIIFGNAWLSGQYSHADSWTHGYQPCVTEDSAGPCYWDASVRDQPDAPREGRSFVVTSDQRVVYR